MPPEIKKRRPRKKRWKRFKEGDVPRGTYIVPNLFTTANLFCGFFGIISAIDRHFEVAALAILASCIFDILDGKVARLTHATSRFGVEYDSLADLVAFGVGPGLLMYLWALRPFGRLGWLAAFVFMACGALRLARFNVQVDSVSNKFFVGLPIPGGASMVATIVLFVSHWSTTPPSYLGAIPLLCATYVLGFLMVSTFPYNSFKDFEFIKSKPLPVIFVIIVGLTVIAVNPAVMLFLMVLTYVFSGPVWYMVCRRRGIAVSDQGVPTAPAGELVKELQGQEVTSEESEAKS